MKQSRYTRKTTECNFEQLHPKFIQYFNTYLEINKLGGIKQDVRHCFITQNEKRTLFGSIKITYTILCLTTGYLFWSIIDPKKEGWVSAAKWEEITQVTDWEDSEMGKVMFDHGVELFGFILFASRRSRWFIGLGPDESGNRCRTLLKESAAMEK